MQRISCFSELKLKRSIVAPNINFVSQLMKFDEEKKNVILQKKLQSEKKATLVAAAPTALRLNKNGVGCASGLGSKRKMMLPLPLKLSNINTGNPRGNVAASAPVINPCYNPFAAAFKKANNNQCTENIDAPFERKLDILLE